MPTRKIADLPKPEDPPCSHPEHNPPTHMAFEPGTYEHECPSCHRKTVFDVGFWSRLAKVGPRRPVMTNGWRS